MKNKDILLKDNKNNNLYPLAHKDSEQNVINDFYYGARVWLASNTNLNDIIKPGSYWLASGRNFTNAPWDSGSNKYGLLEVSKAEGDAGSGGGARRIIQKITRTVVSNLNITEITFWYRYYGTNGWSNWLEYSGTDSTNSFGLIKISGATISASIPGDSFSISGGAGVLLSTSNNTITIGVDTGTLGGGTVTYVAVANTGGLSITGSSITSSGTISIGLTQLISSPPSSVAIYPIKFSKYGRITAFDSAVTIPTKLTDLTNDGNFVQDSSYVHTSNNFTTALKDKLESIESNAQVNTIESISVNSVAQTITDKHINLVIPDATTVDSNFSATSENPLQNKIITNNLNGRMMGYVPSNSSLNGLISAGVYYISEANSSGIAITTNADDSDLSASDKENSSLWPRPYPTFSVNLSDYPYWGYLIVEKISSDSSSNTNNQIKQTLWSIDSSNKQTGWACFFRIKLVNNKWTKWHKIADEDWPINSIQDSDIDHIMIDDLVLSLEG